VYLRAILYSVLCLILSLSVVFYVLFCFVLCVSCAGAPEIDILEAMPGKEILLETTTEKPYFSASLQVAPGRILAFAYSLLLFGF
jgi:hypothetical protein